MTELDELGERDHSEVSDFPPAERVIHTQAYDLSLNTLNEQWTDRTLVVPDFQREYVWDNAKASRLIESLLLNIPIPILFFSETAEAKYEVVDGHQRILSIVRYFDNQFALSGLRIQEEFRGKRFHRLPDREQRFLKTRVMRAIIIGVDSSPTMKFEVFERLNTGGLALNAQEIRNALNSGPFNELLKDLETYEGFLAALNLKRPRKRMVDRELALRFFALRDRLPEYRTPLVRFLNDYMRDNKNPPVRFLREHKEVFQRTMDSIASTLGGGAFRLADRNGRPLERSVNRALFEAQALCVAQADHAMLSRRKVAVRASLARLYGQAEFLDSIQRATGDRARTAARIRGVAGALESAGVPVDLDALGFGKLLKSLNK